MAQQELTTKLYKLYPWLIGGLIIMFIIFHFIYSSFIPKPVSATVKISRGLSVQEIAKILEQNDIISSRLYFIFWQKLIMPQNPLRADIYNFNGNYNLIDIIKILKQGVGIKIVIPEGKTLKEIEKIFNDNGFKINLQIYTLANFPETNLINFFPRSSSLEGFLAPDTYNFYPDEAEQDIIKKLLKNFEQKYLSEILKSELDPYQTLILASIVEKEAKLEDDFALIAGILIKRLKNNWPLDVDAPLVYRVCNGIFCDKKVNKNSIPPNDPFQTYKKIGLIPQPISNPGLKAVRAVVKPQESEFWYYLTDPVTQKAIFAKSLKEHENNIKTYLKNKN